MHKFAGVTLDHLDDAGATLRSVFPTADEVPEVIKTANLKPREKMASNEFALIAVDQGHKYPRFPINDAGSTALSLIYFEKYAERLPEMAKKVAADNLTRAAVHYGILPASEIVKLASETTNGNVVDVTGRNTAPKVEKVAGDHFAFEDGNVKKYPINDEGQVKQANDYWLAHHRRMDPGVRRQFAVKLAARATDLGVKIDDKIKQAGATTYGTIDQIEQALVMRKAAVPFDSDAAAALTKVASLAGQVQPDTYAANLAKFDMDHGLHQLWDRAIPDPFQSTFGLRKEASVIWEDGADRMTEEALHLLANQYIGDADELFSDDVISGFEKDPVGTFNKLPTPLKRRMARLAEDRRFDGGTEAQSTWNDS